MREAEGTIVREGIPVGRRETRGPGAVRQSGGGNLGRAAYAGGGDVICRSLRSSERPGVVAPGRSPLGRRGPPGLWPFGVAPTRPE